ncbi:MAG: FHA domain-containing protein FhaB [Anaerolineales bacterium]|nr:FHA domain-containing protein FhaB [Anaerolineales bacterium]
MSLEIQVLVLRLVLIIGLYLFLLAVAAVAWRELRASAVRTSAGVATPAAAASSTEQRRLTVVDAGESALRAGDGFRLRPVTSLGRDMANTIVIPDPSASGEHALISTRDGHWWLEDLGSTNGTYLNDTSVEAPTIIARGDIIRVGHVQLKLE